MSEENTNTLTQFENIPSLFLSIDQSWIIDHWQIIPCYKPLKKRLKKVLALHNDFIYKIKS